MQTELPAAITPEHWLVVPRSADATVARVFAEQLLDPHAARPRAGSRDASKLTWLVTETKHPAGVVAAFTQLTSERDEIRMARLSGAELLFVNGEGFVGDSDARGFRGVPIALKEGANDMYVLGIANSFELELWTPQKRVLLATWDVSFPSANEDDFTYSVFNASVRPVSCLHVHYGHVVTEDPHCPPEITDWRCGGRLLPLGVRIAGSYWLAIGGNECPYLGPDRPAVVRISVAGEEEVKQDEQVLRVPAAADSSPAARRTLAASAGSVYTRLGPDPLDVYGSDDADARAAEQLARVRFDQQLLWYRSGWAPEVISDRELAGLAHDALRVHFYERRALEAGSIVLCGNADTNTAWKRFVPESWPIEVREGRLVVEGREFRGDDLTGWFLLTWPDGTRVIAHAHTGVAGMRLGYVLRPRVPTDNSLHYAFYRAGRQPGDLPQLVIEGTLKQ